MHLTSDVADFYGSDQCGKNQSIITNNISATSENSRLCGPIASTPFVHCSHPGCWIAGGWYVITKLAIMATKHTLVAASLGRDASLIIQSGVNYGWLFLGNGEPHLWYDQQSWFFCLWWFYDDCGSAPPSGCAHGLAAACVGWYLFENENPDSMTPHEWHPRWLYVDCATQRDSQEATARMPPRLKMIHLFWFPTPSMQMVINIGSYWNH